MNAATTTAYLLAGSNDHPDEHLVRAVQRLNAYCTVLSLSSVYCTKAQDSAPGAPDYHNLALKIAAGVDPGFFKQDILRAIEAELGRERSPARPRVVPIDLDILLWGDTPLVYGDRPWRSPSPDILRYAHAAIPLAELAPDLPHPETRETLAMIAARFPREGIQNLGPLPLA